MAVGPYDFDGELAAPPEQEWPGELPDYVEEWNQLWWEATAPHRRTKPWRWLQRHHFTSDFNQAA